MLYDIINYITGIAILAGMFWVVWIQCVMIEEKKERQRKGLTDYYDMPIKKDDDETIS